MLLRLAIGMNFVSSFQSTAHSQVRDAARTSFRTVEDEQIDFGCFFDDESKHPNLISILNFQLIFDFSLFMFCVECWLLMTCIAAVECKKIENCIDSFLCSSTTHCWRRKSTAPNYTGTQRQMQIDVLSRAMQSSRLLSRSRVARVSRFSLRKNGNEFIISVLVWFSRNLIATAI